MQRDGDDPGTRSTLNLGRLVGALNLTALAAASRPREYSLPETKPRSLFGLPIPRKSAERRPRTRGAGLVLIVDDSEDTRRIYSEYLNFRGFWTVTAPDGEVSIPMAHNLKPDVIVMDLAMPRLDGVGAIRRLKQSPSTSRIPVILLTGHAMRAIQQGAMEAGAEVFLTKPCLPEDLEDNVRRVIGKTT